MTKIVGFAMIIISCAMWGMNTAAFFKTRAASLEAICELIKHIGAEIDGFLTPLDSIYATFRHPLLENCGFLDALKTQGGETALEICGRRLCLCTQEYEQLKRFFHELGRHEAGSEAKHCAYYEAKLRELAKSAHDELRAKTRMSLSFGVLAGIMLSVILL